MSKVNPSSWAWRLKRLNVKVFRFCYQNDVPMNTYQSLRAGAQNPMSVAEKIEEAITNLEKTNTKHEITLAELFEAKKMLEDKPENSILLKLVNTTIQQAMRNGQ